MQNVLYLCHNRMYYGFDLHASVRCIYVNNLNAKYEKGSNDANLNQKVADRMLLGRIYLYESVVRESIWLI